jgi:peptidoglycan hydrolase-like protein with peptidoglycan-binding domain
VSQTRRRSATAPKPTTTTTPPAAVPPPSLRRQYADWPQRGDTRPQPWDLDALGVPRADRELAPGAPDTVSPIVVRHRCRTLTSGEAGPLVAELAARLHELGYPTSISRGENPYTVFDHSVMAAVERFRADYGVEEDPTPYSGARAADQAAAHVGPYTWEGIIRVSDRERREREREAAA